MDQQLPIIHSGPGTSIPSVSDRRLHYTASGLHILSTENDYLLTPNLSWVKGKHTLKFGADWRDMQNGYYQTFDGGIVLLHNGAHVPERAQLRRQRQRPRFACCWGSAPAARRRLFRGRGSRCTIRDTMRRISGRRRRRLTVTAGIRWEIPGVWRERYNRLASFNPTELNPALKGHYGEWAADLRRAGFPGDSAASVQMAGGRSTSAFSLPEWALRTA